MCTLAVWWRVCAEAPIVAATNRDELLDRPAEPPARRDWGLVPIFAPRDSVAGGTWIGVNARGLFVAVTNRFGGPRDATRRSRGLLVAEMLSHESAASASDSMAAVQAADYNGFHLLVADADAAWLLVNDGATASLTQLAPGLHVITERSFGAAPTAREPLLRERLSAIEPCIGEPLESTFAAVFQPVMATHAAATLDGVCVHADALRYGTRSSSLVRIDAQGRIGWLYAPGPPCTSPYQAIPVDFG